MISFEHIKINPYAQVMLWMTIGGILGIIAMASAIYGIMHVWQMLQSTH